jgi:hypothetical protein
MARNIATKKIVEVSGLKELQQAVSKLVDAVDGQEMQTGMAQIAAHGEWMMKAEMRDQNWPKEAIESTFAYGKLPPSNRRRSGPSALFGVRKRGRSRPWAPGYVEWGKRTGKVVGESLATMFEFGTAKMSARPAMRIVVQAMRAFYPDMAAKVLQKILDKHQKTGSGTV